jgi:type IV pilus assembly protein PilW
MQIWYGLSQGAGVVDASGRLTGGATAYVTATQVQAANQWDRVIAVRVSLLLRSVEDNLVLDPQTIVFNGVSTAYTDRRMRYVMDTTINVRNQAP